MSASGPSSSEQGFSSSASRVHELHTSAVDSDRVYLDYAATAPLDPRVLEAMYPYLVQDFGNASALYHEGRAAFSALEKARSVLARRIGARMPAELIFTSGGTESDNAAIHGIAEGLRNAGRIQGGPGHVVCSQIEHSALLKPVHTLRALGFEVTELAPDAQGFVTPEALATVLRADTVLVSVMMANNEVGTIQPIRELAALAHERGALFHTDAVQALGKVSLDVGELAVDAASFSAHKICGPKGVGGLYLKQGTPFFSWLRGGGQEAGRRGGTQNVTGAVGFARAAEIALDDVAGEARRLSGLRDMLAHAMRDHAPRIQPVTHFLDDAHAQAVPGCVDDMTPVSRLMCSDSFQAGPACADGTAVDTQGNMFLPHIASFLVEGLDSETLVLRFDEEGIAVSGGSACSSASPEPSHVLRAMGISSRRASGLVRFSLGRWSTEQDIERVLTVLPRVLR